MPGNYPHYYYVSVGLIVRVAGKSFTQVNVHHGRIFCTLGPSTSLPYFHKCMSYLCIISYAMDSYHQFQDLIKAGVGSEEVSGRICCADHVV